MIIRSLKDISETEREVQTTHWISRRLLLKKDGMGFSFHITRVRAGAELDMCYKHHLEAVFCIKGEGSLVDLKDGKTYPVQPGTLYALNDHDPHILKAKHDLELACVFNPPLTGTETHREDGSYPISPDEPMSDSAVLGGAS